MQKKIIKRLITLLFVVLLLDPTDKIFHLKMPLFLMTILIWISAKAKSNIKFKRDSLIMILALLSIALFGIGIATIQNSDVDYVFSLGFIKSLVFLSLLIIIIDLDMEPDLILNKYSIVLPIIIISLYIIIASFPILMVIAYEFLVLNKEVAMISNRNFYGYDVLMVYYKTSAMLVFPLSFYCKRVIDKENTYTSVICVILFFISLIMSGTRANMVSAVVIFGYYMYNYLKKKKNVIYSLIAIISVLFVSVLFLMSLSFDKEDQSADIKSGHFVSFIDNMKSHPEYLLWGQGLGSKFYTTGNNTFATQTELTYFDLIRFFGIPLTIIFLFLIIYPVIHLFNNNTINERNRYAIIAYVTYLFISGTNPLLISSTGMVILIIMYSFTNKRIYNSDFQLSQIK